MIYTGLAGSVCKHVECGVASSWASNITVQTVFFAANSCWKLNLCSAHSEMKMVYTGKPPLNEKALVTSQEIKKWKKSLSTIELR